MPREEDAHIHKGRRKTADQRERVGQAPPLQNQETAWDANKITVPNPSDGPPEKAGLYKAKKNYWPASSLAVIKPSLSMPAPRMTSMARATSMNSTSLSPLTKAIFSARSLKISSMRGPRRSQVVSSLLILSLPLLAIWTTTVLFSSSTFCCWFGEG